MKPTISIIAAISKNLIIGQENKLLWHIPEDLRRFKQLTLNHPVIMGRKTFDSIGNPLPNRTNIVVTHDKIYSTRGCIVTHSLTEAIEIAKKKLEKNIPCHPEFISGYKKMLSQVQHDKIEEIFIIGGGQIYAQAIHLADKLYLTIVKGEFTGDTYFPDYSQFTHIISREDKADANYQYVFLELTR